MHFRTLRLVAFFVCITITSQVRADIYRWDTGEVIPGTEGIEPGPGVQLADWNSDGHVLDFADFLDTRDLTGAIFHDSSLVQARFNGAMLTNATFFQSDLTEAMFATCFRGGCIGADLSGADLGSAVLRASLLASVNLANANLTNAVLDDANLNNSILTGSNLSEARIARVNLNGAILTADQLYATASYRHKDLQSLRMSNNNLNDWSFVGQDLTGAVFGSYCFADCVISSTLLNADFSDANLTNASFLFANLANATLSGATVVGANFSGTTSSGFSRDQLYSTRSYKVHNLDGIRLEQNDLSGWDFSHQSLRGANLDFSNVTSMTLTGADLTGASISCTSLRGVELSEARISGARFPCTGMSSEQLYSTSSYKAKNLQGVDLGANELRGWDFTSQNLDGADFSQADMVGAQLENATIRWAAFRGHYSVPSITKEQIYATASYKSKDLRGIDLSDVFLNDWNFAGQNLMDSTFGYLPSNLTYSDLRGFRGPDLHILRSLENAIRRDGTLDLALSTPGEPFVIRDDDGVPNPTLNSPLAPRAPIPVTIQHYMTVDDVGTLQLQFESDPWDSLISFEPGIPVQLGGTLELTFADDVDVATQLRRTLRIFDWTGVSPIGQFTVSSSHVWDTSRLYTTGEVTLLAVPEPSVLLPVAWSFALVPLLLGRRGVVRKRRFI